MRTTTFLRPPPAPTMTSSSFIGVFAQKGSAWRFVSAISGGVPISLTVPVIVALPGAPAPRWPPGRRGGRRPPAPAKARARSPASGKRARVTSASGRKARRRSMREALLTGAVRHAVKRRWRRARRPPSACRAPRASPGSSRESASAGRRAPDFRRGRSPRRPRRRRPRPVRGSLPAPTLNPSTTVAWSACSGRSGTTRRSGCAP